MQINLQHKSYSCMSTVCITMKHLLSCSKNKKSHFISIPCVETNQFIQCSDRITNGILILRSTITGHGRIIYEFWDFFYIKQITYFYQMKFSCSKVCKELQSSTVISCTWLFSPTKCEISLITIMYCSHF